MRGDGPELTSRNEFEPFVMDVPKHVFGLPGTADGPLRQSKLSDRLYEQIFALVVSGELP